MAISHGRMMGAFALLACALGARAFGVNATVQRAWESRTQRWIYSLGFQKRSRREHQYYEFGLAMKPAVARGDVSAVQSSDGQRRTYPRDFYAVYGSYHFIVLPLFRPGIVLGSGLERKDTYWVSSTGSETYHKTGKWRYHPYAGISIQAGIASFVVTLDGIGFGLNYQFRRIGG